MWKEGREKRTNTGIEEPAEAGGGRTVSIMMGRALPHALTELPCSLKPLKTLQGVDFYFPR